MNYLLLALILVLTACGTVEQPTASVVDQVTQALSHEASPELLILPVGTDGVSVHDLGSSDPAGQAETLAVAVNLASNYEKIIWQTGISGLSSATVTIALEDYQNGDGTTSTEDVAKAIVTSGTGTSLDWRAGTPAERFGRFDVHWVVGQGSEPL